MRNEIIQSIAAKMTTIQKQKLNVRTEQYKQQYITQRYGRF